MTSLRSQARVSYDQYFLGVTPKQQFRLEEKLTSHAFNVSLTTDMKGEDFSLEYLQRHGFTFPLRFSKKDGLGIVMPKPASFTVKQVRQLVGSSKKILVQCCKTQTTIQMSMGKFAEYYLSDDKEDIYNVLSLEFSDTKMDRLVKRPSVVDQIDWVDMAFPTQMKKWKSENENDMYYPKVQKYCLMSVAGSYTTFHVDFGGTSVWYHVLKGKKIFWLIEPTDENLNIFERWISTNDDEVFLGDLVSECQRVELNAGMTFLMPGGWIHAVYTPVDSLVFGGNFLHSFNAPMQERIVSLESNQRIPMKQRFPLLKELQWYLLDYCVRRLEGKSYLASKTLVRKKQKGTDFELSRFELKGLSVVIDKLAKTKKVDYVSGLEKLPTLHAAASRALEKYRQFRPIRLTRAKITGTSPLQRAGLGSANFSCHTINEIKPVVGKKRKRLEDTISLLKQKKYNENQADKGEVPAMSSSALKTSLFNAALSEANVAETKRFDDFPFVPLEESLRLREENIGVQNENLRECSIAFAGALYINDLTEGYEEQLKTTCLRGFVKTNEVPVKFIVTENTAPRRELPCSNDVDNDQNLAWIDDLFEEESSDEENKVTVCLRLYASGALTSLQVTEHSDLLWVDELIEHRLSVEVDRDTISVRRYAK